MQTWRGSSIKLFCFLARVRRRQTARGLQQVMLAFLFFSPLETPPSLLYSKQETLWSWCACSVWTGKPSCYSVYRKTLCPQTQEEVHRTTVDCMFLTRLQMKLQTRLEAVKARPSLGWALLAETTNDLLVIAQEREACRHLKQGFGNQKEVSSLSSSLHHLASVYNPHCAMMDSGCHSFLLINCNYQEQEISAWSDHVYSGWQSWRTFFQRHSWDRRRLRAGWNLRNPLAQIVH